jgi:GNAT superfamily N-acetyltransferase
VSKRLVIREAAPEDAAAMAEIETAAVEDLTQRFGHGRWSYRVTQRSVQTSIRTARGLVAVESHEIVGTLTLQTRKRWSIDVSYFTDVPKAIYLIDMAVKPNRQRQGIGTCLLEEARRLVRAWPANSIRLDAYDAAAGAGPFYVKCGFTEMGHVSYRGTPLIYYEALVA